MTTALINSVCLFLNLVGVVLLFLYGMPFRVRSGGGDIIVTSPTPEGEAQERLAGILGWLGLAMIVAATVGQIVALWV